MKSAKKNTVRLTLDLDEDQVMLLMADIDATIDSHLNMRTKTRSVAMLREAVERAGRRECDPDIAWEILKLAPVYRALLDAPPRTREKIASSWVPSAPSDFRRARTVARRAVAAKEVRRD